MPDDHALPFELEEHDVSVRRGEWWFYIRAVRRGESLTGSTGRVPSDDLTVLIVVVAVLSVVDGLVERWRERQPWTVGVVRVRGDRWGPTGRLRVVHRERVAGSEVPAEHLAALASRVRAGDFDD